MEEKEELTMKVMKMHVVLIISWKWMSGLNYTFIIKH